MYGYYRKKQVIYCSQLSWKRKLATVKGKKADKELTLEIPAFLSFTVANLHFQLSC